MIKILQVEYTKSEGLIYRGLGSILVFWRLFAVIHNKMNWNHQTQINESTLEVPLMSSS